MRRLCPGLLLPGCGALVPLRALPRVVDDGDRAGVGFSWDLDAYQDWLATTFARLARVTEGNS